MSEARGSMSDRRVKEQNEIIIAGLQNLNAEYARQRAELRQKIEEGYVHSYRQRERIEELESELSASTEEWQRWKATSSQEDLQRDYLELEGERDQARARIVELEANAKVDRKNYELLCEVVERLRDEVGRLERRTNSGDYMAISCPVCSNMIGRVVVDEDLSLAWDEADDIERIDDDDRFLMTGLAPGDKVAPGDGER
jgi:DNA repair exonuclease SbcCD ATPase subunit